jgi:hypothetical protein
MRHKQLLVPVSAALTALVASIPSTDNVLAAIPQDSSTQANGVETTKELIDPVLQRLTYQIKEQAHDLTLHKSSSGVLYAAHGSHRSHRSHGSHRSGR